MESVIMDSRGEPKRLTVKDLQALLACYPPDMEVCYAQPEGGFQPVRGLVTCNLLTDVNTEYWYGPHDYENSVQASDVEKYIKKEYLILLK